MSKLREKMLKASKSEAAGYFDEDDYGKIRDWIDTGSCVLNVQISGSVNKGIPSGRILQFAGAESVGKCHHGSNMIEIYVERSKLNEVMMEKLSDKQIECPICGFMVSVRDIREHVSTEHSEVGESEKIIYEILAPYILL